MGDIAEKPVRAPFYLKYIGKPDNQSIVNVLAVIALVLLVPIMLALGVFQFFYAERASQYFGLTEFEYLQFYQWTFTAAQLPALGVAGGLVIISLLNAFQYETYYSKHPRPVLTPENNPFLYRLNRFLPVEWFLNTLRAFIGYVPNDTTWIQKLLFALIEGYFIYVALSVEKADNQVVHQLGLMVAIGLPLLSYVTSHGFAWLFFYIFDYNSYRGKLLNEDNAQLQQKLSEMQNALKELEKERDALNAAISRSQDKLDESLEMLGQTDDELERLKAQKTDLLQKINSISNGTHPLEVESQLLHLKEENAHLKETIEMNLRFIETALSNTRESLGFMGNAGQTGRSYEINDPEYLEAEKAIAQAGFAPSGKEKSRSSLRN